MEQQQQQQQQQPQNPPRLRIVRRQNNTSTPSSTTTKESAEPKRPLLIERKKPEERDEKSVIKLVILRRNPNPEPNQQNPEEPSKPEERRGGRGGRRGGGRGGARGHEANEGISSAAAAATTEEPNSPSSSSSSSKDDKQGQNRRDRGRRSRGRPEEEYFNPHYPLSKYSQWLKDGVLLEGAFKPTFSNRKSFVQVTSFGQSTPFRVSVEGVRDTNRAFENDIVVIELYPPSMWKPIKKDDDLDDSEDVDNEAEDPENEENANEGEDATPSTKDKKAKEKNGKKKDENVYFLGDEWMKAPKEKAPESTNNNGEEQEQEQEQKEKAVEVDYAKLAADKAAWNKEAYENRDTMMALGRVVAIKREANPKRIHAGYIEPPLGVSIRFCDGFETFSFKSVNRRLPWGDINRRWTRDFVSIFHDLGLNITDYVFEAKFAEWTTTQRHPQVISVRTLGKFGDIEVETGAILAEYEVPDAEVSPAAAACLPTLPWSIPDAEFAERRDLRDRCIYTVDPLSARDLDDAVSCWPAPDGSGNLCVGVHIADVSYFVRPDTELDKEAATRSTSTYLVQRVIPMLPRTLCEDLCSLNPGVDRLAFSCMWTMKPDGTIIDEWFGRTVIRSCCKLSYDIAQGVIDGKADTEKFPNTWDGAAGPEFLTPETVVCAPHNTAEVAASIAQVAKLTRILRKKRFDEEGSLKIGVPKLTIVLSPDGVPVGVRPYIIRESNELVEDMMLLANRRVALRLSKFFPKSALLRRHPTPKKDRMEEFLEFCSRFAPDVPVDASSSLALRHSVDRLIEAACERYGPEYENLVSMKLVRTMALAEYFSATDVPEPEDWAHYGLAFSHYTHFTSPIRRYPDLLVHRQLQASIDIEMKKADLRSASYFLSSDFDISKICEHSNDRKTAARKCQDASTELFLTALIRDSPITTNGIVSKIDRDNVGVFLPEYSMDKSFSLKNLKVVRQTVTKDPKGMPCATVFWAKDPSWVPKEASNEELLLKEVEAYAKIIASRDSKDKEKRGKGGEGEEAEEQEKKEVPISSLINGRRVLPILQAMDTSDDPAAPVNDKGNRKEKLNKYSAIILDAVQASKVLTVGPSGKGVFYHRKRRDEKKEEEEDGKEEEEEKEIETITQEIRLFEKIKVIIAVHPTRRPLEVAVNILHPASYPGEVGPSPILIKNNDSTLGKPSKSMEEQISEDL